MTPRAPSDSCGPETRRGIALDLRIVQYARTGFHRWARGLLASLEDHPTGAELHLLRHPDRPLDLDRRLPGREVALDTPLFVPDEALRLADELADRQLEVLHFPFSLFPGRVAPRVTLTLHDLTCLRFPESIEPHYLPYYRGAVERASEADLVVVDSRSVLEEVVAAGIERRRVVCCHPVTPFEALWWSERAARAPGAHPIEPELRGRPYVLCVGSIEPRKNLLSVLRVFERLHGRDAALALVIVGWHGWGQEPLLRALADSPARSAVHLVGDAEDDVVRRLMRGCEVFLCLSLYEGFGYPVLEALHAGACVVSSPVPSLVEAGFPRDGLVEPLDVDGAAAELGRLLGDQEARADLAARGRAPVARYYAGQDPARLARVYGERGALDPAQAAREPGRARSAEGGPELRGGEAAPLLRDEGTASLLRCDTGGPTLLRDGVRVVVYQVFYDQASRGHLDPRYRPCQSLRATRYLESAVIAELLAAGHHRRCDYFGVFSWKFARKIPLEPPAILERMAADGFSADVYSFFGRVRGRQPWLLAEAKHPGILEAARVLLERVGVAGDVARLAAPPIYQNHFLCRPALYERFHAELLAPCLAAMDDESDGELQGLLARDPGYRMSSLSDDQLLRVFGRPHATLHPFVCERLFSTWLGSNPGVDVRQIWDGRFVEQGELIHEPEHHEERASRVEV